MIALGIDTGANTAWAIVDVPARQIEMPTVLAVGMFAREDRPGQLRQQLNVSDDTHGYRVDVVGIESVARIFPRKRFGAPMATALAEGERIVGDLRTEAAHAGYVAIVISAAQWRKALIGKARAKNPQIAQWVKLATQCAVKTNNLLIR